ncbi:MAG: NDP-sugar synthase [Bryobacteraceae bacterium]
MRAIIIATGFSAGQPPLAERMPNCLLPLIDRPFVQHVVEYLAEEGVREVDFVLSHFPEKFEELLGDGSRWGSQFRFHLARDGAKPFGIVRAIAAGAGEPVLLAQADRLPKIRVKDCRPSQENPGPVAICCGGGEADAWTGWAWLCPGTLQAGMDQWDQQAVGLSLVKSALPDGGGLIQQPLCLRGSTAAELLESQRLVLNKRFTGLLYSGRESQEGIWIGRNVVLHPTARLESPVYLGENCRVGAGVLLGPNAVLVADTVIDRHCSVTNAAVLPRSYVGEALHLENVIVDRNRLINAEVGSDFEVVDDFILGSLSHSRTKESFNAAVSRITGIALFALLSPVLLLTALLCRVFRRGPVVFKREVVQLPASGGSETWKSFSLWSFCAGAQGSGLLDLLLRVLPGLLNVARGELRLVGVTPRTSEETRRLPSDWRSLYLRTKGGLVTEAGLLYGAAGSPDELYSAEAFYAVAAGPRHDIRLMGSYLCRLFGFGKGNRQA